MFGMRGKAHGQAVGFSFVFCRIPVNRAARDADIYK
jgi:hypothetical protein